MQIFNKNFDINNFYKIFTIFTQNVKILTNDYNFTDN